MLLHADNGQNLTDLITRLNHERMLFQLPVMVFLVVIMAASVIGNCLVVCVYKSKYKKRTSSFFIMVLAIVDLGSALCIPYIVFDLANPYKHPTPVVCKIIRFIESLTSTGSGFILLCIAFDRYFHVCHPLRIYSLKQAQSLTIVMLTMSACLSWPILFLSGKKTVTTPFSGVYGEDCSYRDGMYNSIYIVLFLGALFLMFFINLCLFIVFYGMIFYVIYKRKHTMIGEQRSIIHHKIVFTETKHKTERRLHHIPNGTIYFIDNAQDTMQMNENLQTGLRIPNINLDITNNCDEENKVEYCKNIPNGLNNIDLDIDHSDEENKVKSCQHNPKGLNNVNLDVVDDCIEENKLESCQHIPNGLHFNLADINDCDEPTLKSLPVLEPKTREMCVDKTISIKELPVRAENRKSRLNKAHIRTTRITIILAIVTLTAVVGFVPYLVVSLMINFGKHFQPGMPVEEDLTYEFCAKSYFLNGAANPIIYSVMNPMFRRESAVVLKKMFNIFYRK